MGNELVRIGDVDILRKEYRGKNVVTFKDIDTAHGRPDGTAGRNFRDNKDKFVENEDFFYLIGDELKAYKQATNFVGSNARELTLVTEQGYLMLVKSFTDDLAWQVQRQLVNSYFRGKENIIDRSQLSPQMQLMNMLVENMSRQELEQKRLAKEVEEVKQEQTAIKQNQEVIADTFQKTNDTEDFQRWANERIAQIAESPKFNKGKSRSQNYSLARSESYERLKRKRSCHLEDRVQKAIGRALANQPGIKRSELNKINKIYVIANDKDLRPAYELVVKEMMIAYCVAAPKGGAC